MSTPPHDPDFRAEVARLRSGERRRTFPLGVHVGMPGATRRGLDVPWPVPGEYDAGVRFDVMCALVDELESRAAWCWLTRPGVPEVHDVDLAWLSAAVRAFGAHAVELAGFRAVTKTGWLDVTTGESRTWSRLRV